MDRADWALLTIAAADGQPLSPVQLQKSLFLFEQAYSTEMKDCRYDFGAYDYGPFAVAVYHDAERHACDGLVVITKAPGGWSQYAATPTGLARANELARGAPEAPLKYLRNVVAWASQLSFQQLVRAVYERFPEYRERSVFRG